MRIVVTFFFSESHDVASPHRHVRTRLYFTSESHVHAVIAALQHGTLFKVSSTYLFPFYIFTIQYDDPKSLQMTGGVYYALVMNLFSLSNCPTISPGTGQVQNMRSQH